MDDTEVSQAIKRRSVDCFCLPKEQVKPGWNFMTENKVQKRYPSYGNLCGGGRCGDSLVGFLHVGSIWALSTVVGLEDEGVLLLQLTVQLVLGPDHPLASGLVQDHRFEGDVLPVDPEAADLP